MSNLSSDPMQRLRDHVAKCNNFRWVVDSGKLFFINERQRPDGTTEHFVDRAL